MASYTKNLNLLKKDPIADANDTFNIQTMLNDNWEKLDAAVGAAKSAREYDKTTLYAVGDYCTHDGKLYKCTTAIPAGEEWNAAHWQETSVDAELKTILAELGRKANATHTHKASDIKSGILPLDRGGTGVSSLAELATAMGIGVINRLNDGLGNEYLWKKYKDTVHFGANALTNIASFSRETTLSTVKYSESIDSNGNLVSPSSISVGYSNYTDGNVLKGKYWASYILGYNNVYFTESTVPDATRQYTSSMYSACIQAKKVSVVHEKSYVNSPDINAYPPAVSDGYSYSALGQIGESGITTGSYMGTGMYNTGNDTTFYIGENKTLIIVQGESSRNTTGIIFLNRNFGLFITATGDNAISGGVLWKTSYANGDVKFLSNYSAAGQLNESMRYNWIAL